MNSSPVPKKIRTARWIAFVSSLLLLAGVFCALFSSCGSSSSAQPTAAEGLDLHALVGVVRQATNGEDLERRLNTAGGINNLDLDKDGKVDFLDVTEFGEGEFRGYSLAVHLGDDEKNTQEVAEVKIHQSPNDFTIQVKGNEQIYGGQAFVTSRINRNEMSAVPFLLWAFAPRPIYVHPLVVGGYYRPTWYTPPIVVPVKQYRTVTTQVTKTVVVERPKAAVVQTPGTVSNPNAGKAAEAVKAPLAAPTATQKQFQARPENKAVATGGFGNKAKEKDAVTQPSSQPPLLPSVSQPKRENTVQPFQQRDADKPAATGGFGTKPPTPAPTPTPRVAPAPAPRPSPAPSVPSGKR